jgi:hypothetical protein
MRKTLAIAALAVAGALLAGCGDNDTPAPAPASQSATESVAPSESVPPTVVSYREDIGAVTATLADHAKYPEGNFADLHFVITNHSDAPAFYAVTLAVYDSTQAEVGGILIDTEASGLGTVKPGHPMVIDGPYGADMDKLPTGFTVAVETVERREA